MSLATLFSTITSDTELDAFSFANQDHHFRIVDAIRRELGVTLTKYILDPVTRADENRWAQQHAQMHLDMNAVLRLASTDLSGVDFQNPDLLASWLSIHANEHFLASIALKVS